MIDIEVQSHPDGIRGDQIVNVAILIHLDLSVSRPWAKRPHHHSRPTLLTAEQFGDGIDIIHRKPDDGRSGLHAADLLRTTIDQLGHALALHELGLGHQSFDRSPHGVGPKEQSLMRPARL